MALDISIPSSVWLMIVRSLENQLTVSVGVGHADLERRGISDPQHEAVGLIAALVGRLRGPDLGIVVPHGGYLGSPGIGVAEGRELHRHIGCRIDVDDLKADVRGLGYVGVETERPLAGAAAVDTIVDHVDAVGGILLGGIGVDIDLDLDGAIARTWLAHEMSPRIWVEVPDWHSRAGMPLIRLGSYFLSCNLFLYLF
jgi:hypothetical protein